MDGRRAFLASPYPPRGGRTPFTPRGRKPQHGWSPSPTGLPNFTPSPNHRNWGGAGHPRGGAFTPSPRGGYSPSPRGGRGGFTPRGRGGPNRGGFGGNRFGGGGNNLCFDESFLRFATENPWAELERAQGLPSVLGPLNTRGDQRSARAGANGATPTPTPNSGACELPEPDDDDSFV